jgi:5-methyltetrahydropteroyltriglutamate--homocysteine methyltransferase
MPLEGFAGSVLAVNFGSYPRVGDTPVEQKLRRALHGLDRGEITGEELSAVERDVVKDVLSEQASAGLDIVTDGQVRWHDPLSHLARELEGVEVNGLLRYFDNNFYYRQPVLTGAVRWQRPILLEDLEFARAVSDRPLKAVVTGPLTFAALSKDAHYADAKSAAVAIAEALNRELQSFQELDLAYVQVEEPSFGPGTDRGLLREAYAALTRELETPLVVAPFFGDVSRAFRDLYDLGLAGYHLDLRSHAGNAAALDPRGFPDGAALSLGVLDARNTRLESASDVAREVEGVRARLSDSSALFATSNCGLEFLPRETARAKLRLLCEVRDAVGAARH